MYYVLAPLEFSTTSIKSCCRELKDFVTARQKILWKENVSNYWSTIDVPALIFVGKHDPLVKYEDSLHPYESLKYPIWYELDAPDHLLLESNTDILTDIVPEFCKDPYAFYEKYRHLKPKSG